MNPLVVARAEIVEVIKIHDNPRSEISFGKVGIDRRKEYKLLDIIKIANSNGCSVTIDGYRRTLFRAYYTDVVVEGEACAVVDYIERVYFLIGGSFKDFD